MLHKHHARSVFLYGLFSFVVSGGDGGNGGKGRPGEDATLKVRLIPIDDDDEDNNLELSF